MGQCVSIKSDQKDTDSGHKYLQPSNLLLQNIPSSPPLKEKSQILKFAKFNMNSKASSFTYGSEKEAFYDTQPWLDSDCEDDFYSLNGDFTPSRGSTPFHVSFASPELRRSPYRNSQCHSSAFANLTITPLPSQSPRKKSLSDLFDESGRYVTKEDILANDSNEEFQYASAISSPYIVGDQSSYIGQKTPDINVIMQKFKSLKSVKCCLPQLL